MNQHTKRSLHRAEDVKKHQEKRFIFYQFFC